MTGPVRTAPFLERDVALATLAADFASARGGAGRTALVSGEAGIGKTTLLERFVEAARPDHVLWGACEALFTPHPLGPLHDIARGSQGRLGRLLADGTDRATLFGAVLDELAAPPSPALLILEDIHWADAATLDLVRFLGRRLQRTPALMVLTYRDDELDAATLVRSIVGHLPPRHVTRIALEPLTVDAVTSIAKACGRTDTGLHATTGGNPFFVTELLANPRDDVPPTVRDAVLARASTLDPAARDVLALASIVPRAIETSLVARVLGASAEAIDACIARGLLLAEDGTLRFRHELARAAVESSLPPARSRQLHAQVLAALRDAPVPLARLVHHARHADDAQAVLDLAPRAAAEAALRGARREAAAHCRAALPFAHRLPDAERAALLDDYAAHTFELNDLGAAIPARDEAIALFGRAGDVARQSASQGEQAIQLVRALRNADADAASRRAIELAETLPAGPHLARAYAIEAYLRMLNRDCAAAIDWGERAIALARRFDDRELLAAATISVGAAQVFVDFPRGCATLEQGRVLARDLHDGGVRVTDAWLMLGTASGEVYEFGIAERALEQGLASARTHDLDRLAGYIEAWRALCDVYLGRWTAAGERANAVLAREVAGSTNRVMALVALGRLRTRRGDPGADEVLDEALALAARTGTLQRVAPVRCTRAEAAWLVNDLPRVRSEASAALDLALAKRHPWYAGELAYWLRQAGVAEAPPPVCAQPYALQLDGRWREAAAAWEALGCPYEQARALVDGDDDARRAALAIFDRLGARPIAERVRQRMRADGVAAIPRGPRASTRTNVAGLTAREAQILALVAEGRANAEIAARLSRSTRTVEHHIAAILGKLAVGTRQEAVDAARRRGLLAQDGQPAVPK